MNVARVARQCDPAALASGEFVLTEEDFLRITTLLREESGIHLPPGKAALVYSRLVKRLRALKLQSFSDYASLLVSDRGTAERSAMVAALTTNVTKFFRERHHFDHLQQHVIGPMADAMRSGARLRLWSSACSTGEEAYSLGFSLLSALPDAGRHDVRILATDIDPIVLETARQGIYGRESVAAIAPGERDKWFAPASRDHWSVRDEVKSLIAFKQLNLIGEWPMRGSFHAIFCRNVVIYFEPQTQRHIWEKFRSYLASEGRLYVGHSERVDSPGYISDGVTTYRLAPQ